MLQLARASRGTVRTRLLQAVGGLLFDPGELLQGVLRLLGFPDLLMAKLVHVGLSPCGCLCSGPETLFVTFF